MKEGKKAVPIYIRVSSEDQVQGTSLDTQLREC
jgi:DNA invertase Pin-like site-specific DNA recombinase